MAINFMVKMDEISLFTIIRRPGIPQRLEYRNVDERVNSGGYLDIKNLLYSRRLKRERERDLVTS